MIIEISVPARDYSYAPEIYLFFLFLPARSNIVTLQTVKIAGRQRGEMGDGAWSNGEREVGRDERDWV
jgi:hypothetical protein